jgi:uncharacterized phage-associated protein
MQTTARVIAATIIERCKERGIADVANLKLQKLLYYAQAWNLVFTDEPLFHETCEAWVHGPVVARVFGEYKTSRWAPIADPIGPAVEDPEIRAHIDNVLEAYGNFGATQLERLTHQERPWIEARAGLAPDEPSRNAISMKSMKEFYSLLVAQ